jgi:eukaryotic-like serine/threonine-protein kinase
MPDNDPLNISGQLVAEKYRIERLVGEGGFAVVYRAEHTIWKQPVAVKFFSGLSQAPAEYREELLHQFIQEGALLTELSSQSAGIVQARDIGDYTTPAGQWMPYMVLEWLDGLPLDAILQQDHRQGLAWTEDEVVGFLKRILPILDVAHRRGIAHRDIKPANIFVMGAAARAPDTPCKLLDFGVAKMVSEHAKLNAALAKTGVAITSFTPRYGAPEQFARSYGATGPWTDVYSIALVACEMLTGKVALQGDDLVQFGFSSANPARRPTPRSLGAQVSDQLEAVFEKALAVRPEDRFPNAGEFLESALAAAGQSTPAGFNPGITSRPHSAPSPSIQLAPTVLVPSETPTASPPTAKPEALPPEKPEPLPPKPSKLGAALLVLILLAGGALAFSATELKGAKETRALISSVVDTVRKAAARWLPGLREGAQQAISRAVASLPSVAGQVRTSTECPPSTRRVVSPPANDHSTGASHGEPNNSTKAVCVDEYPVSEVDYAACAACEQPRLPRSKVKMRTRAHSQFCLTGRTPTVAPIQCITWEQADAYCQIRAGRLPTEDELRAATDPMAAEAPMEWTQAAPKAGLERLGPFRCVSSK